MNEQKISNLTVQFIDDGYDTLERAFGKSPFLSRAEFIRYLVYKFDKETPEK